MFYFLYDNNYNIVILNPDIIISRHYFAIMM